MKVTFWGTRGSIPSPGPETVRVGGNTTCLEVSLNGKTRIIVDAGTGIRALGLELVKIDDPAPIILLLTHSHWDHLAGFTFFNPAYNPAFDISVYGNEMAMNVLQRDIFERHDNRYFPVNMDDFRAEIKFNRILPESLNIAGIDIHSLNLNHPGNGFAFRFSYQSSKVAFITDNEIGKHYPGGNTRQELIYFCSDADILIHDAQYLPSEIDKHRGWGHSTYEEVIDIAREAGVQKVYLTHHDPERNDLECDALLNAVWKYISKRGNQIECSLAIEGQSFSLP